MLLFLRLSSRLEAISAKSRWGYSARRRLRGLHRCLYSRWAGLDRKPPPAYRLCLLMVWRLSKPFRQAVNLFRGKENVAVRPRYPAVAQAQAGKYKRASGRRFGGGDRRRMKAR